MIEVKDLLLKFENTLLSEERKIESVKKAITEALGIELKAEDIRIEDQVVYLNLKPLYKNEIFIKKEKIISRIGEMLRRNPPQDIR